DRGPPAGLLDRRLRVEPGRPLRGRARARPPRRHGGGDEHLGAGQPNLGGLAGRSRRTHPRRRRGAVAPARPGRGRRARGGGAAMTRISEVTPMVMGTAWRNLTIVRVRTDDGLEGVGEVRMVNHTRALLGYLAHAIPTYVLGTDPFAIEDLVQ